MKASSVTIKKIHTSAQSLRPCFQQALNLKNNLNSLHGSIALAWRSQGLVEYYQFR